MANFKFTPDLFLEVAELNRFQDFLNKNGFRKNIVENSVNFGLVKSAKNFDFKNARVERGPNLSSIKINEIKAIDSEGLFLYSKNKESFPIQSDGNWYWVKISHQFSNVEEGTVSLSINGDLVGSGTQFSKIFRGMPNFPTRIKFLNSVHNILEYDIAEVIDDNHAIVAHPAPSGTGIAAFGVESNLEFAVVGTFTPGVAVPNDNKFPFQYDSCKIELVLETSSNTRPNFTSGKEFYIARVKANGTEIIVQDKRSDIWETKGSQQTLEIEEGDNPLIGVESTKWKNSLSPSSENEVLIAWGMRSNNWSVDCSQNILTLFGSALGGSFKTVDDFSNGDFDGWRVYTADGNFSRIVSSTKQGQAINLSLDFLDVDHYSIDGGLTFGSEYVLVVPDCEEIELSFQAESTSDQRNVDKVLLFPINTLIARCDIEVYSSICKYNINYRYKTHKAYTEFKPIPVDSVGYYSEISFDEKGNLKVTEDRVRVPYDGSITLALSTNSYALFKEKIYKGDLLGIESISSINAAQPLLLTVGVSKRHQHFTGTITLDSDLFIALSDDGAIESNSFKLHFDCSMSLNSHKIFIVYGYNSGSPTTIKTLTQSDIYEMQNRDGGIAIDCFYKQNWNIVSQNYDLGQPFEIKMFDDDITQYFDNSLNGKVKGYFGWKIHSVMAGRVPVGYGTLSDGVTSKTFTIGQVDGEFDHKLTGAESGTSEHDHPFTAVLMGTVGHNTGGTTVDFNNKALTTGNSAEADAQSAHNNMQPYRVLAYIKKQY